MTIEPDLTPEQRRMLLKQFDQIPKDWQDLIREYGDKAHQLYEDSIPMFANGPRMSAAEARQILEHAVGKPLVPGKRVVRR